MQTLKLNDKIIFHEDKNHFTIKAISNRFAICTRPYNLKKTVFYTIIDFENNKRSTTDLVFNIYDFKNQLDIEQCLLDLESGEISLSRRNQVDLNILNIKSYNYANNHKNI